MVDAYLGEIRMFAFPRVPNGWASCGGQELNKKQHEALAYLLNDVFGHTSSSFNLPDLRGRTPIGVDSQSHPLATSGGKENISLENCINPHDHQLYGVNGEADTPDPGGHMLCAMPATPQPQDQKRIYSTAGPSEDLTLSAGCVSPAGGSTPHNNMQPSLVINFCIAIEGIFPQSDDQK